MRVIRMLCLIMLCIGLLFFSSESVTASSPDIEQDVERQNYDPISLEKDGVRVTISYGIHQQARYGRTMQMNVSIYNQFFAGECKVCCHC